MASRRSTVLSIALLMAILWFSGTEAFICATKSKLYRGRCTGNKNCAMICLHEGFTGGYCTNTIWPQCMCTKVCKHSSGPPRDTLVNSSPPAWK